MEEVKKGWPESRKVISANFMAWGYEHIHNQLISLLHTTTHNAI